MYFVAFWWIWIQCDSWTRGAKAVSFNSYFLHVTSLVIRCQQGYLLEKEMTTHSSILTWKISWTEEPGVIWSMGLQRVRHDWSDWVHTHTHAHTHTHTHTHTQGYLWLWFVRLIPCTVEDMLNIFPYFLQQYLFDYIL